MTTSATAQDSASSEPEPPFAVAPRETWIRPASNTPRLFWMLRGLPETAIAVLDRSPKEGPETFEPYYNATTCEYHAIAALPVSEPPVSSMTVHVALLQDWEGVWLDWHWKHSEPDLEFEGCEWGVLGSDRDKDEVDMDDWDLLRCCGEPRPRDKDVSIEVLASGDFVTVGEYITAVHPWLMSLRSDILDALRTIHCLDYPLPHDTVLVLDKFLLNRIWIATLDDWMHGKTVPEGLLGGEQSSSLAV